MEERYLINKLKEDNTLDRDKLHRFITMAEEYLEDLEENIYKTVFQLGHSGSLFSVDDWLEFTDFPVVKTYRDNLTKSKSKSVIEKQIAKGEGNINTLVGGLERISGMGSTDDRSYLVVTRLPLKEEVDLIEREAYMRELDS